MLNQRGGRMLSLVDLIKAGTISLELASEMILIVSRGGSFLTAAGPGGVGKTTLMGALLAFLPPDTEIVTVEGPATLKGLARSSSDRAAYRRAEGRKASRRGNQRCLMVHEIGSGSYFGYLWGPAVAEYFSFHEEGFTLASNLHAMSYEQARDQLTGPTLGVADEHFGGVDIIACMARDSGKRRVTSVWRADGKRGHAMSWKWHSGRDEFDKSGIPDEETEPELPRIRQFLSGALEDDCHLMTQLRKRTLKSLF